MSSKLPTHPLDEFCLPSGGIILKSSDGIEFKVHKNLLSLGSGFFETMFSLPQPSEPWDGHTSTPGKEDSIEEMQVIEVSEPSEVMDKLLRFIYPVPTPSFPGVSEHGDITNEEEFVRGIAPILEAAIKYDMQATVDRLSTKLLDAARKARPDGRLVHDTLATRIYVVACKCGHRDLARRAAHISLKGRVQGIFFEDFRDLRATQYFPLVSFHDKISKAMIAAMEGMCHSPRVQCYSCGSTCKTTVSTADWWNNWYGAATQIVQESPASEKVFTTKFCESYVYTSSGSSCSGGLCRQIWSNWILVSGTLKENLKKAIDEVRGLIHDFQRRSSI